MDQVPSRIREVPPATLTEGCCVFDTLPWSPLQPVTLLPILTPDFGSPWLAAATSIIALAGWVYSLTLVVASAALNSAAKC